MRPQRALLAAALLAAFAEPAHLGDRRYISYRDPDPERQAAAQAKRDRKAAKRRAEAAKHRRETP